MTIPSIGGMAINLFALFIPPCIDRRVQERKLRFEHAPRALQYRVRVPRDAVDSLPHEKLGVEVPEHEDSGFLTR